MFDLAQFVGRFHPVVVHVPIGALLLLVGLELVGAFRPRLQLSVPLRRTVLGFALVGAVLAAGCGWLLGEHGSYEPALLDRHRWLGLATLFLMAGLLGVAARPRWYGAGLAATLLVLVGAGHNGGTLTHGEGYLVEHAPAMVQRWSGLEPPEPGPANLEQVDVFAHVVQPILKAKCVDCHGPSRIEGELRLDSFAGLMAGGKSGAAVVAGAASESRLLQRLFLPMDDKQHMPPAGRPQPTDDDIAWLQWWIGSGAPETGLLMQMNPDPDAVLALAEGLGLPPPPLPDHTTLMATVRDLEQKLGVVIRSLEADELWLEVNARLAGSTFDDAALAQLESLAPVIHQLDLGGTDITDQGLAVVSKMERLRRLRLDQTGVGDVGLAQLAGLTRLESLNLHTTKVTDVGITQLQRMPRLRRLYLWQTDVTPQAATALAEQLEDRARIDRYQQEIGDLERRISAETFQIDFGANLTEIEHPDQPEKSADY